MQQIFGDFVEEESGDEYLVIHFSPTSIPLQQRWRNSGLSADFLAEYWATFFPAHDVPSRKRQIEVKGAINYIANELLENLMKFSYRQVNCPVSLGLYLYQTEFRFYASNAIAAQDIGDFQARIQTLLTRDPQALYLQQLEKNAADENSTDSGLGLLTMLNDYGAKLAWKFETSPENSDLTRVITMVQLAL
ncbi:MAG: ATP-binding protein [Anaerolineae bacterium]|nr:ATP-binding protein [Anaerolineae bacterium]